MLHSALITNEVVEARPKKRSELYSKWTMKRLMIRLIRSSCYTCMLRRFNFNEKWIMWIKACLISSKVSVVVNGSSTSKFGISKGLRQGNLLAPFLFTIMAEGLRGLMRKATRNNLFKSYKVGEKVMEVNLLQYADDTIFKEKHLSQTWWPSRGC